jgi:hypothetical protein
MTTLEHVKQSEQALIDVIRQATLALDGIGADAVNAALRDFEEAKRNALARLRSQADAVRDSLGQLARDAGDVAKQLAADVVLAPVAQQQKQTPPAVVKQEATATPREEAQPAPEPSQRVKDVRAALDAIDAHHPDDPVTTCSTSTSSSATPPPAGEVKPAEATTTNGGAIATVPPSSRNGRPRSTRRQQGGQNQ